LNDVSVETIQQIALREQVCHVYVRKIEPQQYL